MSRAAIFLDRDGVLNDPVGSPPESPYHPADVRLAPSAAEGVRSLREAGYALVVVTNQPAAAKGTATVEALDAVSARVRELLGVEFDGWYTCLHHPAGVVPYLSGVCDCRKPAPGMLLQAAHDLDLALPESWIVGDTDADIEAGRRAGIRTVLIPHPGSAHRRTGVARPDLEAVDLGAAAAAILG